MRLRSRHLKIFIYSIFVVLLSGFTIGDGPQTHYEVSPLPSECPQVKKHGMIKNHKRGCFDFYSTTQTWFPEFCFLNRYEPEKCRNFGANLAIGQRMVMHNLSPNFETVGGKITFPVFCQVPGQFFAGDLDGKTIRGLQESAPQITDIAYWGYQWAKHGSCSGLDSGTYFTTLNSAMEKIGTPSVFAAKIGTSVTMDELSRYYKGLGMTDGMFLPICHKYPHDDKQYLVTMMFQFGKDLTARPVDLSTIAAINAGGPFAAAECDASRPIHVRKGSTFMNTKKLENSIKVRTSGRRLSVGFDFDGTIVDGGVLSQYISLACGDGQSRTLNCLQRAVKEFDAMGYDRLGPFKRGTSDMIRFHLKKGDKVYIITKRSKSDQAKMPQILREMYSKCSAGGFGGEFQAIDYTDGGSKTALIAKYKLNVYYGDQDSDMLDAMAAGATPVRVVNTETGASGRAHVGIIGEDVLDSKEIITYFAPSPVPFVPGADIVDPCGGDGSSGGACDCGGACNCGTGGGATPFAN